jgi:hypothetical protein
MPKTSGITKGEWRVEEGYKRGSIIIIRTLPNGGVDRICDINVPSTGYRERAEADAEFICLCANECQSINPDHPEYVAKKMGEAIKLLKKVDKIVGPKIASSRPNVPIALENLEIDIMRFLADIERKE